MSNILIHTCGTICVASKSTKKSKITKNGQKSLTFQILLTISTKQKHLELETTQAIPVVKAFCQLSVLTRSSFIHYLRCSSLNNGAISKWHCFSIFLRFLPVTYVYINYVCSIEYPEGCQSAEVDNLELAAWMNITQTSSPIETNVNFHLTFTSAWQARLAYKCMPYSSHSYSFSRISVQMDASPLGLYYCYANL